ncbi:MAG TPA: phosphoribosylaminoimidazolesuccinocarboxamide synthase, partial [Gammaproteobacteria bacterium]|nr:phosphoribosylaminoimidazolesuccinocarboxamide synthase [Gammaproteobacteria bacterium]
MLEAVDTVFESELSSLDLLHRGKVRDIYAVDEAHMLIVASDRLSAFDVVLPDPIPGKGAVLTDLSVFWFGHTGSIVRNHLSGLSLEEVLPDESERRSVEG